MNAISQKGGLLIISLERRRGDPKEEEGDGAAGVP